MGTYINKGNVGFQYIRNGEYVDKSGLIAVINRTLFTEQKFTCVTRCRRFGKSMAAKMLAAYYDSSCDSRALFADLQIAGDPSFEKHLNKYPVIYVDITDFITHEEGDGIIVHRIERELLKDISTAYPDVPVEEDDNLMKFLLRVVERTKTPFIFIIDEWDAICREYRPGTEQTDYYVNWLRRMFKSVQAVTAFAGVYMTGILPIKKYKTESALNNFWEYSMVNPGRLERFFGFTKEEVLTLTAKYQMDYDELEKWYDGYQIGEEPSIFNPNSVMQAIYNNRCVSYMSGTGTFTAVVDYIRMDFEGLKNDIIRMLAGDRCDVDPTGFQNDMSEIHSRDDVLTVLIHMGYLSYDWRKNECYIPNREVAGEMVNAVKANNWTQVTDALQQSRRLLEATLAGDEATVAQLVEAAHTENASIIKYNNENAMACVLSIAYYYAHGDYIFHREFQTGKGFADLVLIPRKNVALPAIIVELKYNNAVGTAIDQIHERRYPEKVAAYADNILLVGINYDKEKKTHECRIEKGQ